jgi:hypothetical protein
MDFHIFSIVQGGNRQRDLPSMDARNNPGTDCHKGNKVDFRIGGAV